MGKIIDRTGQRFGRLLVTEMAGDYISPKGKREIRWQCRCDCGNILEVRGSSLSTGNTKSCGCLNTLRSAARATTHGMRRSPEYSNWAQMKSRCLCPSATHYANYGGRGITVAPEWLDFEAFFRDMGPRPSPSHSIDRIDVNGNYCPENCRWATPAEQSRNTRRNVWVAYNGQRLPLADAAALAGISRQVAYSRRHRGWTEDRLLEPVTG